MRRQLASVVVDVMAVFVGAGIGGVARYGVNVAGGVVFGARPWATLVINVVGSLVMGLLFGWFSSRTALETQRLFALTGVLGGFTTFSAFSLDALKLWQGGEAGLAAAYVAGSVVLSLLAVAGGVALAR